MPEQLTPPLITVLMPVYNAALFLKPAIESILSQTLKNFEFLIINDASKDNTVAIIESYNDPRIRLIHNEKNMGISATLNKGIHLASSDLIARMDADDISYPERLQKQYDFMQQDKDCSLLSCYVRVISSNGDFIRQEIHRDKFLYYTLTFECNIYHPAVVFRRQPTIDVNMYDIPYAEDYDLFWKMSAKFRVRQLEEVLLDYRISSESTHLVHKKKEYDEALFQVVRRNINHYFEKPLNITADHIHFFRYEYEPVLKKKSFFLVVKYMKLLERVSKKIVHHPNPNNINDNVLQAFYNKRYYTLLYLKPFLSAFKWKLLCIISKDFKILRDERQGKLP